MSIFSYAFGGAVTFSNDGSKVPGKKRFIGPQNNFGATGEDSATYSIKQQLKRYSSTYQETTAKFLLDIPGSEHLNTKMLVAAYYWFTGNESPEQFTPDMFTMDNTSFAEITLKSFEESQEWKTDRLISLVTYAMLIRRNQHEINLKRDSRRLRIQESSDEETEDEFYEDEKESDIEFDDE